MKRILSALLAICLLLSLSACRQEKDLQSLENFADEFKLTTNYDADGTLALQIPANLPAEQFRIEARGYGEDGKAADLMGDKKIEPGKFLVFEDVTQYKKMEIEVLELTEDQKFPCISWEYDMESNHVKTTRFRN